MEELKYYTALHTSRVLIGENWKNVINYIDPAQTVIITDSNLKDIYGDQFPKTLVMTIPAGEKSKNLATIEEILTNLINSGFDRTSFILGIGGGVVCDIAGFVASIFMRGIRFGFVSTSLLSQVDASIGGKNGVNLLNTKNIVGCFSQPEFVICDPLMLETLPEDEFISGLAEVIKHALIRDAGLFNFLEENIELVLKRDPQIMLQLVSKSVMVKKEIVEADERETGIRRLLNFGHTLGHALESNLSLKHGMAIAYGMIFATQLSVEQDLLNIGQLTRITDLIKRAGLINKTITINNSILDTMLKDKKKEKDIINFVLIDDIGSAFVKPIPHSILAEKLSGRSI